MPAESRQRQLEQNEQPREFNGFKTGGFASDHKIVDETRTDENEGDVRDFVVKQLFFW